MNIGLDLRISSRGEAGAFTPLSDAGLRAWYLMSAGVTLAAGNVTALADQSGTGDANKNLTKVGVGDITHNAIDAAYGNQSTGTTLFSGARLEGPNWAASLPQPFTAYAVGHITNNGGRLFDSLTGRCLLARLADVWTFYAGGGFIAAPASTPGSPSKVCVVFNGVSSAIYVGGDFSVAAATGNPGTDTPDRFGLLDLPGGGGPMVGTVAEWVFSAGAHDATLRAQYAEYLEKYGL
jgi:hypothetical protein